MVLRGRATLMIELPGTCQICGEKEENLIAHLQIMHPDAYGEGFLEWPDGSPVIIDSTLNPEDFTDNDKAAPLDPEG